MDIQEEKIRLEAELASAEKYHTAEIARFQETIERLNQQIEKLSGQAGEKYAEGFQKGWQARTSPDND